MRAILYAPCTEMRSEILTLMPTRDFTQYLRKFSLDRRTVDIYLISDFNKCHKSMLP